MLMMPCVIKALPRYDQKRHAWPDNRRSVGQYVNQCLMCQQVRDKPRDVHFPVNYPDWVI